MTKLDPKVIEEAIRLQENGLLYTMENMQVHYSCYALCLARGIHYDLPSFPEGSDPYLVAYKDFTHRRFEHRFPVWWGSGSGSREYTAQRCENMRLFKEFIERYTLLP